MKDSKVFIPIICLIFLLLLIFIVVLEVTREGICTENPVLFSTVNLVGDPVYWSGMKCRISFNNKYVSHTSEGIKCTHGGPESEWIYVYSNSQSDMGTFQNALSKMYLSHNGTEILLTPKFDDKNLFGFRGTGKNTIIITRSVYFERDFKYLCSDGGKLSIKDDINHAHTMALEHL